MRSAVLRGRLGAASRGSHRALVGDALRDLGIHVRLGLAADGFATGPEGRVRAVITAEGEIPADVVVLGLGVAPNAELAREAGIALGHHGGIRVDSAMRTSAP